MARMETRVGNGGWHRVWVEGLPLASAAYYRTADVDGVPRVVELYFDCGDEPIDAAQLRRFPIARLEEDAKNDAERIALLDGGALPPSPERLIGPDLSTLASHYRSAPWETEGWVRDSLRAQMPGSRVKRPQKIVQRGKFAGTVLPPMPTLTPPGSGRLTDDFLRSVASAYRIAIGHGQPPAKAIAANMKPTPQHGTVQSWIGKARKRGLLEPATSKGRIV